MKPADEAQRKREATEDADTKARVIRYFGTTNTRAGFTMQGAPTVMVDRTRGLVVLVTTATMALDYARRLPEENA
jgi:hypothetical protein